MRHMSSFLVVGGAYNRPVADDLAFRALGDPTRRLLLDRLFERDGQTLSSLQAEVSGMTRFGVMKHLRVLEAAGLVVTRKAGREKLHYLNPMPVQLIHDRWVNKYTRPRAAALSALKEALEENESMAETQIYRVFIAASPQTLWDAITKPEFTAQYFYGSHVVTTAEPGTSIRHYAPDGVTLWVDDLIIESDPPRKLVHTWRALYDPELAVEERSRVTWEIEPQPGGVSRLTVIHDQLERAPKTAANVAGGWMFIISGLKTYLETGKPLSDRSTGASANAG
jgi:uncharacterized protein YndB with AHSA1/START domain/DNA-binding transcriptional ArsR family regulator